MEPIIDFLAGAVTLGHLVAAVFFLRFWRRTSDGLFLAFALAFLLFALNQALVHAFNVLLEPQSLVYGLRVLGFVLILVAILHKNLITRR